MIQLVGIYFSSFKAAASNVASSGFVKADRIFRYFLY
jgi:hypothetical protein